MGEPLQGEALLAYVRARLQELDEVEARLPAVYVAEVDRASMAYKLGRITGLAAAYHDVEHLLMGWYGDQWEHETEQ